jgi:hypothetical protein
MPKPRPAKVAPARSVHQKELQSIHDLCGQLKRLSENLGLEYAHRREVDYHDLMQMTDRSKNDDEMDLLAIDAAMGIINLSSRKQALRKRLQMRIKDEKELTNMMQSHKDDFTQFIWRRRLQNKRDVRALFQGGIGNLTLTPKA